jgi:phospholipid/cholesterol/gamma-HCH transport system substrate-binding protein
MSGKANNFKLGVFVIVSTLLLLVALSMLGAGALFKETIKFETVFTESVQGLDVGAAVKSQGVEIGTVSKIDFARYTYPMKDVEERFEFGNYILVEMELDPKVMSGFPAEQWGEIFATARDRGLRVRMTSSGLTGPAFLAFDWLDPEKFPAAELYYEPKSLYVPSAPSQLSRFVSSVENILDQLEDVKTGEIATALKQVLIDADSAVQEARPGIAEFKRFMRRLDNMVAEQESDLEAIVVELRGILDNIEDITENAKGNPSQMIFGDPPPRINPTDPDARK